MKSKYLKYALVVSVLGISAPCIHYARKSFIQDEPVSQMAEQPAPEFQPVAEPSPEELAQKKAAQNEPTKKVNNSAYTKVGWKDLGELNPESGKLPAKLAAAIKSKVMVPGFIVPLSDGGDKLDSFLLVPEPMMCIHVPPPPPQYIVQAKMESPIDYPADFSPWEPYWIKGTLKVSKVESELAEAAYEMTVEQFEKYIDPNEKAR